MLCDGNDWELTCERASTYGPREYAGQIEHTDPFKRMLDIPWVVEDSLWRVTDLGDEYGVDVRLEYPMWCLVHLVV
jgi:hypothetical protein